MVRRWILRFGFFLPAIFLAFAGLRLGADGLALDAAVPVPNYLISGLKLPNKAYVDASDALRNADAHDGDAMIARAETKMLAGRPRPEVESLLNEGLSRAPANARGWTLLAEDRAFSDPHRAADALGIALVLGPFDYYLAGRRFRDAVLLWNDLDPESRGLAQQEARLLWGEPNLAGQRQALLANPLFKGALQSARADGSAGGAISPSVSSPLPKSAQ